MEVFIGKISPSGNIVGKNHFFVQSNHKNQLIFEQFNTTKYHLVIGPSFETRFLWLENGIRPFIDYQKTIIFGKKRGNFHQVCSYQTQELKIKEFDDNGTKIEFSSK